MSDLIDAIIETRKTAEQIAVKSLVDIEENSEIEVKEKILAEIKAHNELFPLGWYDPPPGGIGILFAEKPFKRLQFDSLRDPECWPKETSHFKKEAVGMIYFSLVERRAKMIGDTGFTVYLGNNKEIQKHIKKCYNTTLSIAKHAEIGMKFSDLYKFAMELFKNELKIIGWMTTSSDPNLGINLGHTVPGSFEENFAFGDTFEEIKNTIRTKRIYINNVENFKIPETCAFTVEARLADSSKTYLPNVFFHFIVCFNEDKKVILENFSEIFKIVGMNYMNSK